MCYTVIIERGPNNFSADAPDFPGCVAAAETEEEIIKLMQEALAMSRILNLKLVTANDRPRYHS